MIISPFFKDKAVLVVGLGKTGIGAVKSLLASGARVCVCDDKISLAPSNTTLWAGELVDYVLLSPGIPIIGDKAHKTVAFANSHKIPIISDMDALYLASPNAKFIGITGTNGKSTTTALIWHILKSNGYNAQVGGNIGVSVLELDPAEGQSTYYVLEISSFQLDLISTLKLDYACLLNITEDHIDRHLTLENYIATKMKIFSLLNNPSGGVVSIDYPLIPSASGVTTVSTRTKADVTVHNRKLSDNDFHFDFTNTNAIKGQHNDENIAVAYSIARKIGIAPQQIIDAILTFNALEHRMEPVLQTQEILFVNDSKATNADATEKALLTYDNIHLILGGIPKEGGISSIANLIKQKCVSVYLIGDATESFAKTLDEAQIEYIKAGNIDNVLKTLRGRDSLKGVVLLSPACASYDQFENFEQRGRVFKQLVIKYFKCLI